MAKIGVDVDDTLYSFANLARGVLAAEAAKTGDKKLEAAAYASWPEWRTPVDLLGVEEWLRIIAICHDEEMIRQQQPYQGAADLLTELAVDHELVYVSSRDRERYVATREWLTTNLFPAGNLICVDGDKKEALAGCQYLIDDRPRNLIDFIHDPYWFAANGNTRKGFGLMTEFNRALTDVKNIYLVPPGNWNMMRHYFVKTGVLKETVNV